MAEVNTNTIQVEGLDRLRGTLESLTFTKESEILKRSRSVISKALKKAQKEGESKIGSMIPNNQRHAEKGFKARQYSKKSGILGGYVSIMRSKRNGNSTSRAIPPTKSGKPRQWSDRTKQLWGYQGADAQFIMWFLTVGTRMRKSGIGRSDRRTGEYSGRSFSHARSRYFGGTHNVGKINANTINPGVLSILQRVVDGEIIPEIDKLYTEIANKNK